MDRSRSPEAFAARLRDGPPLLLDGALGTELERRGCPSPLPLWSTWALIERPEQVRAVHADYAGAGADVLCAGTFRTQARTLAAMGRSADAARLTALAVALARAAADDAPRTIWVAGSQPPLADCFAPERVPDDGALAAEHRQHANHLAAAGADLILVETHHTLREIRAAVAAAAATGLPVLASFVCDAAGALLSGEPLGAACETARAAGAWGVGVNCVPPSAVPACLPALCASGHPFGVYANLGAPRGATWTEARGGEAFAVDAASWSAAGARWLGGCCGTGPAHIAALRAWIDGSTRSA